MAWCFRLRCHLSKHTTILAEPISLCVKEILPLDNLINKYQSQYTNLNIKINKSFHDRFIIIDNTTLYHCGASFKDLGKKCFAINKIDNKEWLNELLLRITP